MSKAVLLAWARNHTVGISVFALLISYAALVPALWTAGDSSFAAALQAPSGDHIFGTDHFGFDLFVRTAESLRVSLFIGLVAAALATTIGVAVGLLAAGAGGIVDRIVMRLNDAVNAVPHLILTVVIVAMFKGSVLAIIASVALTHWSPVARVIRSTVLAVRTSEMVECSYGAGASLWWVVRHHLAPAAAGQALVSMAMLTPHAVWHESTVSFLGLGISADSPSLGTLMDLAREDITRGAWWALVFPSAALLLTTLSGVSLTRTASASSERNREGVWLATAAAPKAVERPTDGRVEAAPSSDSSRRCFENIDQTRHLGLAGLSVEVGATRIISDVNLDVCRGEILGLVGSSGAGKSTVGRVLIGDAPRAATVRATVVVDEGECPWDRATLRGLRGSVVGYVPQAAALSFTPVRRVGAQLQEIIDRHGSALRVEDLLERVHLKAEVADYFPHQLSGGMAQRAALAAALAGEPQFIVADEPTSALDPELASDVLTLLKEAAHEFDLGVVLISHDLEDLREWDVCDQIAVLEQGELVESCRASQWWQEPGHPLSHRLQEALPSGGLRVADTPTAGRAEQA